MSADGLAGGGWLRELARGALMGLLFGGFVLFVFYAGFSLGTAYGRALEWSEQKK